MKAEYRRLGDFIRQVDVRNKEQKVSRLVGLTIDKAFIPSVANTIGTDISNYKIIRKKQFACSLMQVSRDGKMPVAMFEEKEAIMSPAYPMFEVHSSNLLPDYLMLWFLRPEFDREASFYAVGGVRGSLEWNDFCDMMLPVPPIEEQRRIVEQYQTVERRIKNNERLIALLEDTAQTIFRHRFVDNIDPNNLPEGWRMGTLGEIADFSYGKLPSKEENGDVPVFSGYAVVGMTNEEMFNEQHIVVIARGDSGSGKIVLSPHRFFLTNLAISINLYNNAYMHYLYQHLLSADTYSLRSGSAQAQVTINDLAKFEVMIPSNKEVETFQTLVLSVYRYKETIEKENNLLNSTKEALICKL